jgi:hypothetical protein
MLPKRTNPIGLIAFYPNPKLGHLLILICLVISLTETTGLARALSATQSPELSIESSRRNLGEVFAGEDLIVTFRVKNLGTKALELSDRPIVSGVTRNVAFARSHSDLFPTVSKALVRATPG